MTAAVAKVAVITGAARGIGLAIAQWFLAHGHRVALLDRDGATLERCKRNCHADKHPNASAIC